jgi:nitroreductase
MRAAAGRSRRAIRRQDQVSPSAPLLLALVDGRGSIEQCQRAARRVSSGIPVSQAELGATHLRDRAPQ